MTKLGGRNDGKAEQPVFICSWDAMCEGVPDQL